MIIIPKKKGRKSKKELEQLSLLNQQKELLNNDLLSNEEKEYQLLQLKHSSELLNEENDIQKIPKKRGRKPKGGKIITNYINNNDNIIIKPNIILHLKCNKNDINTIFDNKFESYKFNEQKSELKFENIFYNKISSIDCKKTNSFFNINDVLTLDKFYQNRDFF